MFPSHNPVEKYDKGILVTSGLACSTGGLALKNLAYLT